jgi:hypothetical protein
MLRLITNLGHKIICADECPLIFDPYFLISMGWRGSAQFHTLNHLLALQEEEEEGAAGLSPASLYLPQNG